MIAGAHAVVWVRQDESGNDACRFADAEGGYLIDGSSTDAKGSILTYRIRAREDGTTRRARIGAKSRIFVSRAPDNTWLLNGTPATAVEEAEDIDLGFTPATLTLPIRRLKLSIGDDAEIMVARLDLENDRLTPLNLVLRRTADKEYECLNADTGKTSHLVVDGHGIIQRFTGHWIAQT